jgi:hypothetical protein
MHFNPILCENSVVLVNTVLRVQSSGRVMGLVDEVKVHFPHSFFLFECLVSIIAPNVMVIPNANNFSLLNKLSIVLILFGVCEPLLNVPEIHRVISDPLGLWDVICISSITQPGP